MHFKQLIWYNNIKSSKTYFFNVAATFVEQNKKIHFIFNSNSLPFHLLNQFLYLHLLKNQIQLMVLSWKETFALKVGGLVRRTDK